MIIGQFTEAVDGFSGRLQSLLIDAELSIVPAQPSTTENAPEWRILLGAGEQGIEVGAGWNRTGKRAGAYIAVQIDDPSLGRALRANLVRSAQDDGSLQLLWSRRSPREQKQS